MSKKQQCASIKLHHVVANTRDGCDINVFIVSPPPPFPWTSPYAETEMGKGHCTEVDKALRQMSKHISSSLMLTLGACLVNVSTTQHPKGRAINSLETEDVPQVEFVYLVFLHYSNETRLALSSLSFILLSLSLPCLLRCHSESDQWKRQTWKY